MQFSLGATTLKEPSMLSFNPLPLNVANDHGEMDDYEQHDYQRRYQEFSLQYNHIRSLSTFG